MTTSTLDQPRSHPRPSDPGADPNPRAQRNQLVEQHLGYVERYVRRYADRGITRDDLRQTALVALVQAADRFDPERGVEFLTFAGATIEGSLKRHFRDRSWAVRPPRRIQELHLRVRRADEDLCQHLGRHPTIVELSEHLEVDIDEIHAALEAGMAHGSVSVEGSSPGHEGDDGLEPSWLGAMDGSYLSAEARLVLKDALATLGPREREVIRLRFVENLSQREIGERMGISQSYLSRVLRRALTSLRTTVGPLVLD